MQEGEGKSECKKEKERMTEKGEVAEERKLTC